MAKILPMIKATMALHAQLRADDHAAEFLRPIILLQLNNGTQHRVGTLLFACLISALMTAWVIAVLVLPGEIPGDANPSYDA